MFLSYFLSTLFFLPSFYSFLFFSTFSHSFISSFLPLLPHLPSPLLLPELHLQRHSSSLSPPPSRSTPSIAPPPTTPHVALCPYRTTTAASIYHCHCCSPARSSLIWLASSRSSQIYSPPLLSILIALTFVRHVRLPQLSRLSSLLNPVVSSSLDQAICPSVDCCSAPTPSVPLSSWASRSNRIYLVQDMVGSCRRRPLC